MSNKNNSEKPRNEKLRNKLKNPFKFGSIVDNLYFTNRVEELEQIKSILDSEVHLTMMSPRRYGKTSLIMKAIKEINRPVILLDMQVVTSEIDFAEQLLKKIHKLFAYEKIKTLLKSFRIVPTVLINPISDEINISFNSNKSGDIALEDVLNLINKLSSKSKRLIVVFDEFQVIRKIEKGMENRLRSILQHHTDINYVFLGSQESLIRDIFENNKSPFYHFGYLFLLSKIPESDFQTYLQNRLKNISKRHIEISKYILKFSKGHPYYTQQLAFSVWEELAHEKINKPVEIAIGKIVSHHDVDFERLWNTLNRTDMKILIGLATSKNLPLSDIFLQNYNIGSSSTAYSSIMKLTREGLVNKSQNGYEIEDPFFRHWIIQKRNF